MQATPGGKFDSISEELENDMMVEAEKFWGTALKRGDLYEHLYEWSDKYFEKYHFDNIFDLLTDMEIVDIIIEKVTKSFLATEKPGLPSVNDLFHKLAEEVADFYKNNPKEFINDIEKSSDCGELSVFFPIINEYSHMELSQILEDNPKFVCSVTEVKQTVDGYIGIEAILVEDGVGDNTVEIVSLMDVFDPSNEYPSLRMWSPKRKVLLIKCVD